MTETKSTKAGERTQPDKIREEWDKLGSGEAPPTEAYEKGAHTPEPFCHVKSERLSDGSVVYNVEIPAQTIYCRTDLEAINLAADLMETLGKAGVR